MAEDGDDTGGLTREFFHLITPQILEKYFYKTGCIKHNCVALQVTHSKVMYFRTVYSKSCFPFPRIMLITALASC